MVPILNVDRATYRETRIGAGCKFDAQCHITHNVDIDQDCLIVAQSGVSESVKIGKRVILSGQAGITEHVVIGDAVWLYYRFNLSHRDIEDLLAEPGIKVTFETIRMWCIKFRSKYANGLKRKHQGCGDTFFYANNRAELSHQPTRFRERGMRRFKPLSQAHRFLNVHAEKQLLSDTYIPSVFNSWRIPWSADFHRTEERHNRWV